MVVKIGQVYKSKNSNTYIKIVSKFSGNRHWNTQKLPHSKKSHKIHEGTLEKFYQLIK